jgi:RHS repeat-associated protein
VTDPQGKTTAYAYDEAGRLATQTYPNGARATYAYDANGRLTQLRHTQANGTLLTGVAYTLAANGQRTELREFDGQSPVVGGLAQNPLHTTRYGYDGAGRLASEDVTGREGAVQRTVAYSYDQVGNRTQKTLTTPAGTETTVYGYDADDRLTAETTTAGGVATTISYGWDSNGRLVKKAEPGQVTLYGWDSEDHLIEVGRGATDATAQTVATYAYDAFGHRVKQVEKTAQGDRVTTYLTDTTFPYAQVVEAKTQLDTQTQTARYVWGAGLIAQVQGGQGRYYHADGLGSVKALSDGNGALTDAYEYAVFGEALSHSGASEQPYRFAGEHFDPIAGIQYHRARWYDTNTGRFAALDPFKGMPTRPATLHRYAYAGNDPVNQTDPSGEMTLGGLSAGMSGMASMISAATVRIAAPTLVRRTFTRQISSGVSINGINILRTLATMCYHNPNQCWIGTPLYATGGAQMPETAWHILSSQFGEGSNGSPTPIMLNGYGEQSRTFLNKDQLCKKKSRIAFKQRDGVIGACDEYPFSTTRQGGPVNYAAGRVSLKLVPKWEQDIQGGQWGSFLLWAGIARDGFSDESKLIAVAIPGFRSFAINRNGSVYKW